ncbi:hypothetical protein [Tautonia marina]|uniref:hypothetical protein n=1 Tax=Tautonia marina TaxID=2653855 RepID=UPI001260B6C9|nr:hypothetical protein [Tautonia marina]
MRLGPSYAWWGVCLILMASGCAGPARREGLATPGAGSFPARLLRPADPIARLSPAPLSVGPVGDPGSYTAAGVSEMARPGPAGGGPLTVGGGQLASRGNSPAATPRDRTVSDRSSPRLARTSPPQEAPTARPSPAGNEESSASGEGLLARLSGRAERSLIRSERFEERPRKEATGPLTAGSEPAVEVKPSPLITTEPVEASPILEAGIDLETYAAPPSVAADPDAQLASTRRPVPALSHARESIRSNSIAETQEEDAPTAPSAKPIEAGIPSLPDVFPEDPFATESPDPFQGLESSKSARNDDDVRPTSVLPEERATDRSPDRVESSQAGEALSPFGPSRLTDRLGMRMQRLRDRLTPKRLREDRSTEMEASEATKGFPRLFRRSRNDEGH